MSLHRCAYIINVHLDEFSESEHIQEINPPIRKQRIRLSPKNLSQEEQSMQENQKECSDTDHYLEKPKKTQMKL